MLIQYMDGKHLKLGDIDKEKLNIPDEQDFYLVFKNEKPETVGKVKLKREVVGALRARFVFCDSGNGQDVGVWAGQFSIPAKPLEEEIELPGIPFSSIKVTKIDEDTKEKLANVEFIVHCKDKGYLKDDDSSNTPVTYVSERSQATRYKTGSDGVATINNLDYLGEYTVYEVYNPNPGYIPSSLEEPYKESTLTVTEMGQVATTTITNRKMISINAIKKDADTQKPLPNIGLVAYCEGKGYVKRGEVSTYVSDINQATTYLTDKNGEISIDNLPEAGTYTIYEVQNPYFGYLEVSYDSPQAVKVVQADTLGMVIDTEILNKKLYVKLSGYAWEDRPAGDKEAKLDDVYKENDRRLRNIKVTLKNANGEIIDTRTTNTITNTKNQEEQGAYLFGDYKRDPNVKRIKIEEIRNAYIEFEYNGMCYQTVGIDATTANANKVSENTRKSRQHFKGQLQ